MPAKTKAKRSLFTQAELAAAVLRLAAKGWVHVTPQAIAKALKVPTGLILQDFSSAAAFIAPLAGEVDRQALEACGRLSGTPHDKLFDVMMARFDVMQQHRAAHLNIADAARHDRSLSCALGKATIDGVYRIITAANLTHPPRPVLALGIASVYGWAFRAWRKDDSRDMAKTMAALDRGLRLAGKVAQRLG